MVLLWAGSDPRPSWHMTKIPLRSAVAVTVAVDVMDVPVLTSVTLNSNGGSGITWPRSPGRRDREILRDGMVHRCPREGTVQMNSILSSGHGLSTLDCNWAFETEKEWHCSYLISIKQSPCIQYQLSLRIAHEAKTSATYMQWVCKSLHRPNKASARAVHRKQRWQQSFLSSITDNLVCSKVAWDYSGRQPIVPMAKPLYQFNIASVYVYNMHGDLSGVRYLKKAQWMRQIS